MDLDKAFALRETLSDSELERLAARLKDDTDRYRDAIRGYSPEKMVQHGAPYLAKLEAREVEVGRLRAIRKIDHSGRHGEP